MPNGEIQLVAKAAQDVYLTNNPKISFFKSVYKRYTNFSMELIKLEINSTNSSLKEATETEIEFKIDRNGDLINNMYFVFTLPDIYSTDTIKFQWIHRIGEYIIKEVSLHIGNAVIDTLYGQWLHIWNELTLDEEKKDGYNRMIGNISDLYNPLENNGSSYPASTSILQSIKSRKIIVPIPFYFTYNTALSLPLISLQYEEIKINFKLRPFQELYTVIDSNSLRIKSPTGDSNYNLGKFTTHGSSTQITSLNINPPLEVNYVYLDTNERNKFGTNEIDYLVQTINLNQNLTISPQTSTDTTKTFDKLFDLQLNNPVSHLIWVIQRSDFESSNRFYNYTNWPNKTDDPIMNPSNYDDFVAEDTLNPTNINCLKNKSILKKATLKLNGNNRFNEKDFEAFNYINNYQHMKRIPEDGIYCYSFGVDYDITKVQPNGSCNMSAFESVQLELKTCPSTSTDYTYKIYVYAVTYNILRIQSGMGGLQFSN